MTTPQNHFVWYELMTSDADAAEAFYKMVAGWGAQDSGLTDRRYTMLTMGDMPVAGLMPIPDEAARNGARPGWIGYIGVDDVDAAATKMREAGGAVHRAPEDIPNVGRFAIVADQQGAMICLFCGQDGMSAPPRPPGAAGHFGWHELHAADGKAAFDFYAGQFGWTKDTAIDMGPMGTYQLFATGDAAIGGMMTKMDPAAPPHWLYYVNVDDIEAAGGRVTAAGGRVVNGPHEVPGGMWIVHGADPQGAIFALVGPRGGVA